MQLAVYTIPDSESDSEPKRPRWIVPSKRPAQDTNLKPRAEDNERPYKRIRAQATNSTDASQHHHPFRLKITPSNHNRSRSTQIPPSRPQTDNARIKNNIFVDSTKAERREVLLPDSQVLRNRLNASWAYLGLELRRLRRIQRYAINPSLADLLKEGLIKKPDTCEGKPRKQRKRSSLTSASASTSPENAEEDSASVLSTPSSPDFSRAGSHSTTSRLECATCPPLPSVDTNALLPSRPQRRRKLTMPSHYSQTGPERPDEFQRSLHARLSRPNADRKDPRRAKLFEAYIAEQTSREEPDAPPIRVIPHRSEACPELNFIYTSRVVYQPGARTTQSFGCKCIGGCQNGDTSCACYVRQTEENQRHGVDYGFAYDEDGLLVYAHDEPVAIWECNDMCGCPPDCRNRRVGRGRQIPIDLFRTPNCGWGARLGPPTNPWEHGTVEAGTFVGVYSGELIPTVESHKRDQLYQAIHLSYLFDLDFISIGKIEGLRQLDDDGLCFSSSNTKKPSSITLMREPVEPVQVDKRKKPMEINTFNAHHAVDAFHYGGITRFLNHNCQPNCILRCCYVNEGDPTKPLLAIFTIKDVRPGDELTISYSGDLGLDEDIPDMLLNMPASVAVAKGKVKKKVGKTKAEKAEDEARSCWCSTPLCTGRMFRDETDSESSDTEQGPTEGQAAHV